MKKAFSALAVFALLVVGTALAQSATINSNEVRVNNGAPSDVFFNFPVGSNNVEMVQFGCSGSSVNANHVYIYELQPNGFINGTFSEQTILCDEQYGVDAQGLKTMSATLTSAITVKTPDHTVTITSANWTATHKNIFRGYEWQATGGSAQITVQ